MGEDRLQLRAEHQPPRRRALARMERIAGEPTAARPLERVVERLLAQAVARQQKPLVARVPERDGEHSVDALGELFAPLKIRPQHHLGVRAGVERVAALAQLGAERVVPVALAVEEQRHAVLHHRLHAAFEVQDREPPVAERCLAVGIEALGVGAAVRDRARGPPHALGVGPLAVPDLACDSTHGRSPPSFATAGRGHCSSARPRRARDVTPGRFNSPAAANRALAGGSGAAIFSWRLPLLVA